MNEYQDQDVWYRLAVESGNADGFDYMGDYDTREDAEWAVPEGTKYMITRMAGLPS